MPTDSNADTAPSAPAHHENRFRYTAQLANEIEARWQKFWDEHQTFRAVNPGEPGFDQFKGKFFCLDMFPYPSGAGLHVGHPEGYTATDIISRYKRHQGLNVLHPMGWDAFGLPAEQYAIATGVHPAITTRKAIDTFRRQLKSFGMSYDWSREFATCDEDFYQWTQWIFLKLYNAWYDTAEGKARPISELVHEYETGERAPRLNPDAAEYAGAGDLPDGTKLGNWSAIDPDTQRMIIDSYRLAYTARQTVNWCPKLGTALANEEVIDGKSERGGFPVFRKPLTQWMFRITSYADRLLSDLDLCNWPESTRIMQAEWIGRSEGAEIDFALVQEVPRLSEPGVAEHSDPYAAVLAQTLGTEIDQPFAIEVTAAEFVGRDPFPRGDIAPAELKNSPRYLPHLELPEATYFVSWRVVPGERLTEEERTVALRALTHFDGDRCRVFAAVVMPDHVHWIVKPFAGHTLDDLTAGVKRFSAKEINALRNRQGSIWDPERFDHIVRDDRWFAKFVFYVLRNPVKAGLVNSVREYAWLHIHDRVRTREGRALREYLETEETTSGSEIRGTSEMTSGSEIRGTSETTSGSEIRGTSEMTSGSEIRGTYEPTGESLRVFTTRPDTIFGATYMVVAPEHPLVEHTLEFPQPETDSDALRSYIEQARNRSDVDRVAETKTKTGVFTGVRAMNPATGQPIPVWTADYVLMGYGTGAIMAVPGQDTRDWEFAKAFALPIVRTVQPPKDFGDEPYLGEGPAINSANEHVSLNGLNIKDAKRTIIEWLESTKRGRRKINFKLRDWLFSRQRYWGEPFPIVFDERGHHYPVAPENLPVKLPDVQDYQPVESDEPQPMLAKATAWVKTTAGEAGVAPDVLPPGAPVTRETNTMPGWAGSCWYFLRYIDPRNEDRFVGREAERYWMLSKKVPRLSEPGEKKESPRAHAYDTSESAGARLGEPGYLQTIARFGEPGYPYHAGGVDLYIGGAEHAVLHLLYARFWHKVLFDLGEVSTPEPFGKLFHQGLIQSFAYQRADKSLVPVDEVEEQGDGTFIETATGQPVTSIVAKMSKSLKNVHSPDEVIAEFSADTFRIYEMYMGPLEQAKPWNPRDIVGLFRFLQRVWRLAVDEATGELRLAEKGDVAIERELHRTAARVATDVERLSLNTAIAAMIEFVNVASKVGTLSRDQLERFAVIISPFAPHMAEELHARLGHEGTIAFTPWPAVDEKMLVDDTVEVPVQINGKVKGRITVAANADQNAMQQAALADEKLAEFLAGKTIRKVIAVPGKILNLVVSDA